MIALFAAMVVFGVLGAVLAAIGSIRLGLRRRDRVIAELYRRAPENALIPPLQVLGITRKDPKREPWVDYLEELGLRWKPSMVRRVSLVSGAVLAIWVAAEAFRSHQPILWVVSIAAAFAGLAAPYLVLGRMVQVRRVRIRNAYPAMIQAAALQLSSGLTLKQALKVIVPSVNQPLRRELEELNADLQVTLGIEGPLQRFAKRCNIPEIQVFCMTLLQQENAGIEVAGLFRNEAEYLRRLRQQEIKRRTDSLPNVLIILSGVAMINFILIWLLPKTAEIQQLILK